jgi:hypothetical protein
MRKHINDKSEFVCNAPVAEWSKVWYYIFECNTDNITQQWFAKVIIELLNYITKSIWHCCFNM